MLTTRNGTFPVDLEEGESSRRYLPIDLGLASSDSYRLILIYTNDVRAAKVIELVGFMNDGL